MKAHPFKIPRPENERLIVQVDLTPAFYGKLHHHKEMQISLIKNGVGKLLISDTIHRFGPGDIFIIGEHIPHLFQNQIIKGEQAHMITLFFSRESFGKEFFSLPELQELDGFFTRSTIGFRLLENTDSAAFIIESLPTISKLERFISLLKLLKIFNTARVEPLSHFKSPKIHSIREGKRLQTIFDFVFTHFHKEIVLDEVAALVYMTPRAFCRYFKQHTNKTFFQFLIELRVEHACHLRIQHPELPMKAIAFQSGFQSISNFNRQFKKLKRVTPKAYVLK